MADRSMTANDNDRYSQQTHHIQRQTKLTIDLHTAGMFNNRQ